MEREVLNTPKGYIVVAPRRSATASADRSGVCVASAEDRRTRVPGEEEASPPRTAIRKPLACCNAIATTLALDFRPCPTKASLVALGGVGTAC